MDRNAAIRVDGMLIGVRGALDGVAHYMKNNFSSQEYDALVVHIGGGNGRTHRYFDLIA